MVDIVTRTEWEALDYAFRACVKLRERKLDEAIYGFILAAVRTADMDPAAAEGLKRALDEIKGIVG